MSSRYPRDGETVALRPTQVRPCGATGCPKQAVVVRWIQFGPMRGSDDSCVCCCEDHKRIPEGNVKAWCKQFPAEAWKP